jgi:hypothetical protein
MNVTICRVPIHAENYKREKMVRHCNQGCTSRQSPWASVSAEASPWQHCKDSNIKLWWYSIKAKEL